MQLQRYHDLMANVRYDGQFHSIKELVQPDDPEVKQVASVLMESDDFVRACHEFVNSFTTYRREIGDYWTTPAEILQARAGDCDDKAILLVSLLRNKIPPDQVFCAFGHWGKTTKKDGHMWVVMDSGGPEDRIIEATAGPADPVRGNYYLEAIFNDRYALSYPIAIRNFNLLPVVAREKVS
jgi:transglutaminase-like putative cysteine protease